MLIGFFGIPYPLWLLCLEPICCLVVVNSPKCELLLHPRIPAEQKACVGNDLPASTDQASSLLHLSCYLRSVRHVSSGCTGPSICGAQVHANLSRAEFEASWEKLPLCNQQRQSRSQFAKSRVSWGKHRNFYHRYGFSRFHNFARPIFGMGTPGLFMTGQSERKAGALCMIAATEPANALRISSSSIALTLFQKIGNVAAYADTSCHSTSLASCGKCSPSWNFSGAINPWGLIIAISSRARKLRHSDTHHED
jgi:hypothetical protein